MDDPEALEQAWNGRGEETDGRGRRAAAAAVAGIVGLGLAYAVFNLRTSKADLARRRQR